MIISLFFFSLKTLKIVVLQKTLLTLFRCQQSPVISKCSSQRKWSLNYRQHSRKKLYAQLEVKFCLFVISNTTIIITKRVRKDKINSLFFICFSGQSWNLTEKLFLKEILLKKIFQVLTVLKNMLQIKVSQIHFFIC